MEPWLQAHSLDVEAASVCEREERVAEVRDDHWLGIERLELDLDGVEDRHDLGLAGKGQSDDRALDARHRAERRRVEPGREGLPHAPMGPPLAARGAGRRIEIATAPGGGGARAEGAADRAGMSAWATRGAGVRSNAVSTA